MWFLIVPIPDLFSTAKWPVTSALDVSDTSFCHGGHFFSSDMIIGRWL